MTRLELLTIVVSRARTNGFEFRRWYTARLGLPWISAEAALTLLDSQRRYYALLFSHDFAENFWKAGEDITFQVPAQSFQRSNPDGSTTMVSRKGFTRRSARKDAWLYHLREMAAAEDPLRHIRKYLNVEDHLDPDPTDTEAFTGPATTPAPKPKPKKKSRPMPTGLPAFLKRPYPPKASD